MSKLTDERRTEIVDSLVNNCTCEGKLDSASPWEEADREALEALPDAKLEGMEGQLKSAVKNQLTVNAFRAKGKPRPGCEEGDDDEDVVAANEEELTANEWLAKAPKSIVAIVRNHEREQARQKLKAIKAIVANGRSGMSEKQLAALDIDVLRSMAAMAAPQRQVNYAGAAAPLTNEVGEEELETLEVPTINFKEEFAARMKRA